MFIKKRKLIFPSLLAAVIIILASTIVYFRSYSVDYLRLPLKLLSLIGREVKGIILYHKHLIENQRLKKEISFLRRKLYEIGEVYQENTRLRQLLDFKEKSVYPLTAAGVIGRDPSNWSSMLIIDKGRLQNIKPAYAVITNAGLVGRVIEVGNSSSKVMLINDVNSRVAALLQRSRQEALVCGTLEGHLILRYLPEDADVQISDSVITSGLSSIYPKGILIGRVTKIQQDAKGRQTTAIIKPSANLAKLEEVLIVLPLERK